MRLGIACLLAALAGCYTPLPVDTGAVCAPRDPACAAEDFDGDGVNNGEDAYPTNEACTIADTANCLGCGEACPAGFMCERAGRCLPAPDGGLPTALGRDASGAPDEPDGPDEPDEPGETNVCGGAAELTNQPGDACGSCGEVFECEETRLECQREPRAGDDCDSAVDLSEGAARSIDTTCARVFQGFDAGIGGSCPRSGPIVFLRFTPPTSGTYDFELDARNGANLRAALSDGCLLSREAPAFTRCFTGTHAATLDGGQTYFLAVNNPSHRLEDQGTISVNASVR